LVGYLLDASSLLNTIERFGEKALSVLRGSSVLDLTVYEVGNGVWSLVYLHREMDYESGLRIMKAVVRLLAQLSVINIKERVLEAYDLTIKEGLTFYDASYLVAAQSMGLTLVTDDEKLAEKARKYLNVLSSKDLQG